MIAWLVVFLLSMLWFSMKYKNYLRSVWLALRLPGPSALPVLGNVLIIKDIEALLEIGNNVSRLYAPLLRAWIFVVPIVLVYEPEHLKIILSNTKVSDKNFFYRVMHTFIGDGLITSTGEKWRKNRRLIQPYFQVNLLENYFDDFAEACEEMLSSFSNQRHIQITKQINTCIIKVLHKTILGMDLNSENETPFRRGELLVIKRILKPWLLSDAVFEYSEMSRNERKQSNDLHQYVKKILDRRRSRRQHKTTKHTTCLLDRLIELSEESDFSEDDILNETVTFMLAGQDSVGATVAFCLYYLAKYQDIQQKVFNEINEIIYEDQTKSVKIGQLNQMHYLEQCIKETLRLTPSIPMFARVLTSDVSLGNYTIPSGTNIFISPFATHRLPHIFPNPLKFNPDRFSQENAKKIHPYGFIPFSSGPRNCIGYKFAYLEMKTIIASLIKNYHIALVDRSEDLSLSYRVTLRAKGGIWLDIRPRTKLYVD